MTIPTPPKRPWVVAAVDPGTCPTICVIGERGATARFYDPEHTGSWMEEKPRGKGKNKNRPSPDAVARIFDYHAPDLVVVENIWVRPGQGVVSSARLVFTFGLCEGVARGQGRNLLRLFPTTWMKHHGLITRDKAFHRRHASLLAPQLAWAFTRAKDHDRADAYLMALTGLSFLDNAYERAVRRGAPVAHTPQINVVR